MIAVDTNVLVRFLVRDDAKQAARAASLLGENQIWVAKTVLLETEWVLRSLYGFSGEEVAPALRGIAGLPSVSLEDEAGVAKALGWLEHGVDFADALHLASAGPALRFATFDRRLARQVKRTPGMEAISV
jgi:predicted nucleic-acid-binding protein